MEYEKKLREYIESIKNNPDYKSSYKEWAFGAIDFAWGKGLISSGVRTRLENEYELLEN